MRKPPRRYTQVSQRSTVLAALRRTKMARSAHAYVRGNTEQFYKWLASKSGSSIPKGPAVWICGDCHIGNLGPIANAKGRIEIQIRDLDQTVIGNPAHDLVRLGLSLASAARGSDLPGITTAQMIEQMVVGYRKAFAGRKASEGPQPEAVRVAMRNALRRKWRHLARERIKDTKPDIPLGSRFWPVTTEERKEIVELFATESVRRMVTSLRSRDDDAPVEVLDVAYWVKGCSSWGRLRFAVLLGIGEGADELCLVDVKEAIHTVAPHRARAKMPRDNGLRVLTGARHLAPALGERMVAGRLQGHAVFLRELLPQDLKFEIEELTVEEAVKTARFLANVVGKAHARQMDEATQRSWQKDLADNHGQTLDAPSWLWRSVVELMMSHEGGYLDHCRKFAIEPAG